MSAAEKQRVLRNAANLQVGKVGTVQKPLPCETWTCQPLADKDTQQFPQGSLITVVPTNVRESVFRFDGAYAIYTIWRPQLVRGGVRVLFRDDRHSAGFTPQPLYAIDIVQGENKRFKIVAYPPQLQAAAEAYGWSLPAPGRTMQRNNDNTGGVDFGTWQKALEAVQRSAAVVEGFYFIYGTRIDGRMAAAALDEQFVNTAPSNTYFVRLSTLAGDSVVLWIKQQKQPVKQYSLSPATVRGGGARGVGDSGWTVNNAPAEHFGHADTAAQMIQQVLLQTQDSAPGCLRLLPFAPTYEG